MHKAVGDQLTCVFVDHGLLRADERKQVEEDYVASTGVRLITIDAEQQFLDALAGVSDPEQKRKIIGREFIRTFEGAAEALVLEARGDDEAGEVKFLVQGTLYPDVVESGGGAGTANIKSHHNVGGLPEDMTFEPRRAPAHPVQGRGPCGRPRASGCPRSSSVASRSPARAWVSASSARSRRSDSNCSARPTRSHAKSLTAAGLDQEIWQCPVVLLADVRSVGVQGDGRTYGHPIVLRPVSSEDAMTADWTRLPYDTLAKISNRITNEVPDVNRVVLDVTSKPPGTIEWE